MADRRMFTRIKSLCEIVLHQDLGAPEQQGRAFERDAARLEVTLQEFQGSQRFDRNAAQTVALDPLDIFL